MGLEPPRRHFTPSQQAVNEYTWSENMRIGSAGAVALVLMLVAAVSGDHSGNLRPIELTQDDLRQPDVTWAAKWHRHPTPQEMRGLPNDRIRENVLYREAPVLGLDKGDTISKRRLAQNMELVSEDAYSTHDPGTDELMAWFKKNQQRFQGAPQISFRQLCFSFAREGESAHDVAARAFRKVSGQPVDSDEGMASLADHSMFQSYYDDATSKQVANVFGTEFARVLFHLKPGSWQGPIKSVSGWHLVWIDSITSGRAPSFAEVEAAVRSKWISEQRADLRSRTFDAMRAR
jgi:peptidyl-prolyl cis-trans isomerase C